MIDLVCAETARSNCYPETAQRVGDGRYPMREHPVTRIGGVAYFFTFPDTHAPRLKARVVLVAQELRSYPATS